MSSVALEEQNHPDYVIVMSLGLSQLGLGDYKLFTESLRYTVEV